MMDLFHWQSFLALFWNQLHNVKTHCDWLLLGLPEKYNLMSCCVLKSLKSCNQEVELLLWRVWPPLINSMAVSILIFQAVPTCKTEPILSGIDWLRIIMTALWTRQQLLKTTVSCCLKDLLNIVKGVIIKEYLWTAGLLTVALSKVLILLLSC